MLVAELAALGAREAEAVDGGAAFAGDLALCYSANLESRVASRVLWQVGAAPYRSEHDIHDAARRVAVAARSSTCSRSIRVNVAAIRSPVKSLDFVTLRVKDAVCDAFRAARGKRPDVDTAAPDVRIHVFLTRDRGDVLPRHFGRCALQARLARRRRRGAAAREPCGGNH